MTAGFEDQAGPGRCRAWPDCLETLYRPRHPAGVIKLYGAMELAPLMNLADEIAILWIPAIRNGMTPWSTSPTSVPG